MKHHIPRSPFATRLSGSAKEMELRIHNIAQGPKKRPPIPFMVLAALAILLCGNLVSCQTTTADLDNDVSSGQAEIPLPSSADDQVLLDLLFQGALSTSGAPMSFDISFPVGKELLATIPGGEYTLAAARFYDSYPRSSLVIGAMDSQRPHLERPLFIASVSGGMPHVVTFQQDGADYLLYTITGGTQGYTYGSAGLIRFDGNDFTWVWPVEGDIRDKASQVYADYQSYWENRKALLCPGGVEIFAETPNFSPGTGSSVVQWTLESIQSFYTPEGGEVPPAILWSVRSWLEEFTRDHDNPWDAADTSALWRIHSLTKDDFQYPNQSENEQAYVLVAQADDDDHLYFAADILIDEETGSLSGAYLFATGTLEEVTEQVINSQQRTEAIAPLPQSNMQPWPGGLLDPEVCLYRDGDSDPVGPGSSLAFSYLDAIPSTAVSKEEIIDDWTVYNDGDYWLLHNGTIGSGSFSVIDYYYAVEATDAIYTLDTTSDELYTPRGIRVGNSRQEVEAAYPEAYSIADSGYSSMWYFPSGEGQGPVIQFIFQNDTVTGIRLYNCLSR